MGQRNLELRSPIGRQQTDQRLKLWMEFLRISPSYGVAWDVISGKLPESQGRELVPDLPSVLRVARDFGDVWSVTLEQHWQQHSFDLFGVQLAELDLKVVHVMQAGQPTDEYQLNQQVREFATHTRREMGNPLTVLVSVPIDMNRQELVWLFGGMLTYFKEHREDFEDELIPEPRYQINSTRHPEHSLRALLDLVNNRISNPNITHRELAEARNINRVSLQALSNSESTRDRADAVNVINATISRMLKQAISIAENAARGKYPDQSGLNIKLKEIDFRAVVRRCAGLLD
jgi:hypothetical protein